MPSLAPDDTPEDRIGELCRWFEDAETQSAPARRDAERDRDYRDHIQWTRAELDVLEARGQPALTINYVSRKVDLLLGLERRQRSDPKAFPRTPQEADRADVATQALRYVADDTQFDQVRSAVYDNLLVEGYGGAEVVVEPDQQGGYDVVIRHVPWDRIVYDPHSRAGDFSDARFLGVVIWMDRDEAAERFPDAGDAIEATFAASGSAGTYDDRPADAWTDNRKTRVRIVQMHYREGGEWMTATFTKGGAVAPTMRSPYIDRQGKSACPLILRSAYVDRKNNRYGVVRSMISLQDEVNKRRSKALHWANSRQAVIENGTVEDEDRLREDIAKPNSVMRINPGMKFELLPSGEFTAAQMALLQHATVEMQAEGPNASMAGKDPRALSGRAIQAQQQGGALEVEPLVDELRQWTRQVYQAVWMRVRQFWTGERWIRVTDDQRNVQWVGLNRRITVADALAEMPPEQRAMAMQQMMLVPNDPRLQQVLRVENEIGDLDADITIEEGPNSAMLDSDQAQLLAPLVDKGWIPPEALVQVLPGLRNKDKILAGIEQQRQAAAQAQQAQQQAGMAKAGADIRKTNADADKSQADAALKQAQVGEKRLGLAAMVTGASPLPGEPVPQAMQEPQQGFG